MSAARVSVEVPFSARITPLVDGRVEVMRTVHTQDGRPVYQVTGEINDVISYLWTAWHSDATEVLSVLRQAQIAAE